mmetsp:Transcript_42983/g.100886  ORF Transcript_42983/g.100886 Transcript_42983/m.100886 type:complete len:112 (-) Transcript_42983:604-939(-)
MCICPTSQKAYFWCFNRFSQAVEEMSHTMLCRFVSQMTALSCTAMTLFVSAVAAASIISFTVGAKVGGGSTEYVLGTAISQQTSLRTALIRCDTEKWTAACRMTGSNRQND